MYANLLYCNLIQLNCDFSCSVATFTFVDICWWFLKGNKSSVHHFVFSPSNCCLSCTCARSTGPVRKVQRIQNQTERRRKTSRKSGQCPRCATRTETKFNPLRAELWTAAVVPPPLYLRRRAGRRCVDCKEGGLLCWCFCEMSLERKKNKSSSEWNSPCRAPLRTLYAFF